MRLNYCRDLAMIVLVLIFSCSVMYFVNTHEDKSPAAVFSDVRQSNTYHIKPPLPISGSIPSMQVSRFFRQHSSLRGTVVDRPRIQMREKKLELNGTLLFYFDYFLSMQGELTLASIKTLFMADARENYPLPIAEQLYTLFLRYCEYLKDVAQHEAEISAVVIREQHLSAKAMQEEVQSQHFSSAEIASLFEHYDQLLGGGSKAAKRQEEYEHFQQQLKESPEQFEQSAQQIYGVQAANNLRNVKYQRQQWQGRIANYQRELRQIEESYRFDEQGKWQSVDLLKHRHFNGVEIKRLDAMLRIQ